MSVEVVKSEFEDGFEPCCVCKKQTLYWYEPKDVALCPRCATASIPEIIPTKEEWFAQDDD